MFAQLHPKACEQRVGVTTLRSGLCLSLLPHRACAWCVLFVPPECLKLENCVLSFESWFCCIFPQAKAATKPRKQGAQGHLPGSTS